MLKVSVAHWRVYMPSRKQARNGWSRESLRRV